MPNDVIDLKSSFAESFKSKMAKLIGGGDLSSASKAITSSTVISNVIDQCMDFNTNFNTNFNDQFDMVKVDDSVLEFN